jgi:hypothetical protein
VVVCNQELTVLNQEINKMNILTDIMSLIKRKQYVKELSKDDVFVIGLHKEPDILGIASPVPYKSVSLAKVSDIANIPSNKIKKETVTTASDPGEPGDIRVDANYIYVCTAANVWKRATLTSF